MQLYKVDTRKQINIKNRTYYFYNDIIDLKNFDARLLKIDKKSYKDINIYNIEYVTKEKLVIVKMLIVLILCIWVLLVRMDTLKKNTQIKFSV